MTGGSGAAATAAGSWQAAGRLLSASSAGPSPLWYATRATGVISLVLLTATVVLGVAGRARFSSPRWPRVVTAGLHRNLSLLMVGFVAAHILTTVLDSYAPIGWAAVFLPFISRYRPVWLGLGAVACDLLLALVLTSLLRARLSYRGWRAVHWLAYACWPIALWHGLGAGTDSRLGWLLGIDAVCVAAVTWAALWRISLSQGTLSRVPAVAATAGLVLITVIFVLAGPLRPGWARRAGTPADLLGAVQAAVAAGPSTALPLTASFTGTVTRAPGPAAGEVTITVAGRTSGSPRDYLRIILRGWPDGQGITLSAGRVKIGPGPAAASYQGPVLLLRGRRVTAALRNPAGTAVRARLILVIHGNAAHGRLSLQAARLR
jgi:hypothetical protein